MLKIYNYISTEYASKKKLLNDVNRMKGAATERGNLKGVKNRTSTQTVT